MALLAMLLGEVYNYGSISYLIKRCIKCNYVQSDQEILSLIKKAVSLIKKYCP